MGIVGLLETAYENMDDVSRLEYFSCLESAGIEVKEHLGVNTGFQETFDQCVLSVNR